MVQWSGARRSSGIPVRALFGTINVSFPVGFMQRILALFLVTLGLYRIA